MNSFIKSLKLAAIVALFLSATSYVRAQSPAVAKSEGNLTAGTISQAQIDEIIRKFSSKEGHFQEDV